LPRGAKKLPIRGFSNLDEKALPLMHNEGRAWRTEKLAEGTAASAPTTRKLES